VPEGCLGFLFHHFKTIFMQVKNMPAAFVVLLIIVFYSCQKNIASDNIQSKTSVEKVKDQNVTKGETPHFNLEVILRGENNRFGLVKFRQDNDAAKIVTLETWVRDLAPNHTYLLQRAVDTQVDGNCTSTAWLTLGKGLEPQAIETDARGTGRTTLFRDLSAIPSGTAFDIHFQVLDAMTMAVVLTSGCYTYTVR
jgi:hypothetical protein